MLSIKKLNEECLNDNLFNIGDIVYQVGLPKFGKYQIFKTMCPLCKDTKELTVDGFTFACPFCFQSMNRKAENEVSINDYVVKEVIVYKYEIVYNGYTKKITQQEKYLERPSQEHVQGFWKYGRSYDDIEYNINIPSRIFDFEINEINNIGNSYFFFKKNQAEDFCKKLHDIQRKKLKDFNDKFGTSHIYPYSDSGEILK